MTNAHSGRRDLLRAASATMAGAALFGGFGLNPAVAAEMAAAAGRSEKPLKAAFSNAGLQGGARRASRPPNTGASCSTSM